MSFASRNEDHATFGTGANATGLHSAARWMSRSNEGPAKPDSGHDIHVRLLQDRVSSLESIIAAMSDKFNNLEQHVRALEASLHQAQSVAPQRQLVDTPAVTPPHQTVLSIRSQSTTPCVDGPLHASRLETPEGGPFPSLRSRANSLAETAKIHISSPDLTSNDHLLHVEEMHLPARPICRIHGIGVTRDQRLVEAWLPRKCKS